MNNKELRKLMMDKPLLDEIYQKTSFIDGDNIPIRQRLWHIDNGTYAYPLCNTCNKVAVKWSVKTSEYRKYCSTKCAHNNDAVKKKIEQTCLEKYGHTTNLKMESNKEKQKQTCIERYGVDNYAKTHQFQEKFIETSLKRYGVTNPSKLSSIKDKITATHLTQYGRIRQSQSHISESVIDMKNDSELMRHWFYDLKMPVSEIAEQLGICSSQLCIHFKQTLGIDISRHTVSRVERQVSDFLNEIGVEHETSNRKIISPKEIDIVVPQQMVAIEVNGVAWHGENRGKDKWYHIGKMDDCTAQGYRLVQVTDDEWNCKKDIVKSRLSGIFQKNKKIWARKCIIREISPNESRLFFNSTHIQGYATQKIAYGLFCDDVLVAAMSFCKSRYNTRYEWELLRYSNVLYTNVIGGASKLLSYFIKTHTPSSLISYCDLRWNTGKVYEKIGFVKSHQSKPNFTYVKNGRLESRVKYQKHKLSKLLANFDPNLTERENMKNNGYDIMWDCGNSVYILDI